MLKFGSAKDASVQALSSLVALQTLDLAHCYAITDAGGACALPLVALRTLNL